MTKNLSIWKIVIRHLHLVHLETQRRMLWIRKKLIHQNHRSHLEIRIQMVPQALPELLHLTKKLRHQINQNQVLPLIQSWQRKMSQEFRLMRHQRTVREIKLIQNIWNKLHMKKKNNLLQRNQLSHLFHSPVLKISQKCSLSSPKYQVSKDSHQNKINHKIKLPFHLLSLCITQSRIN